ncbi:hypothetical protein SCOR_05670 [Sulfidibacter corallicola]
MDLDRLKWIYNACDPFEPATSKQYKDCSAARGGGIFVDEFTNHLRLATDCLCILFTGHIGSGKSTELLRLRERLLKEKVDQVYYLPVLVDMHQFIDDYDTDTTSPDTGF